MESIFLVVLVVIWAFQRQLADLMVAITERIRQGSKEK